MNISEITTLISTIGFPIACCIYLIYAHREESKESNATINCLREAIQNLTIVVTELKDRVCNNGEK